MSFRRAATIVTGATGYVGSLVAGKLLAETDAHLVLPVRPHHSRESVLARITNEVNAVRASASSDLSRRVSVVPLPPIDEMSRLGELLRGHTIVDLIHCAGCVDYFHSENLAKGNPGLTKAFVDLAHSLRVRRFVFVSTAFSSGYSTGQIPEELHESPAEDPTEYTRSKREAESIVVESGIPFLLVRPSVVVGDSRNGRYGGKRYGLYQLWYAAEKLMCVNYVPRIYAIAPRVRLPVLHQDAFQNGFLAAYRTMPTDSVIHLVSRDESLPTVRDVWDQWLMTVTRPREIFYFDRLADVPMEKLSRQQQMWVELTGVNLDISSRPWPFETAALDCLRQQGLHFADATAETIGACQARFIADSARVRTFMDKFQSERAADPHVIEC